MIKRISALLSCTVLVLLLFLLSSCVSSFEMAGTALEQGDYTTAIIKSLEALEKDPDLGEANVLLKDAWQRANSEWSAQITTIEQATTADQLYESIALYNKLLKIHDIVQQANRSDLNPNKAEILEKALVTQSRIATLYPAVPLQAGNNAG